MYCEKCGSQIGEGGCPKCKGSKINLEKSKTPMVTPVGEDNTEVGQHITTETNENKLTGFAKILAKCTTKTMIKFVVILAIVSIVGFFVAHNDPHIDKIKKGSFPAYEGLEIGKVFDYYFDSPNWKGFENEEGKPMVEFTGNCSFLEEPVKVCIQFQLESDDTFEIVYLEMNGEPSLLMGAMLVAAAHDDYIEAKGLSDQYKTLDQQLDEEWDIMGDESFGDFEEELMEEFEEGFYEGFYEGYEELFDETYEEEWDPSWSTKADDYYDDYYEEEIVEEWDPNWSVKAEDYW